jgi:aspartyl-tRNA(Asn)/glutamyl-tRNA(Gln) amidotransferase subunit C
MAEGFDIDHLAKLARLSLTPAEKSLYASQLGQILGHFQALAQADLPATVDDARVVEEAALRTDEPGPGLGAGKRMQGVGHGLRLVVDDPRDGDLPVAGGRGPCSAPRPSPASPRPPATGRSPSRGSSTTSRKPWPTPCIRFPPPSSAAASRVGR